MHDIDVVGDICLCKVCCIWLVIAQCSRPQLPNMMLPRNTNFGSLLEVSVLMGSKGSVNI